MPQITVNTGMDTKPVWNGVRDMNKALRSLRSYVSQAGKEMNASVVGYARAMRANADASREVDERVRELNGEYSELVQQIDELANTQIDTKEYADLKKEIVAAQEGLTKLIDKQKQLKDLGRDTAPTKEFKDNQSQLSSLYKKRMKLDEDYNNANKQMASANDVYQDKLRQLNSEIARKNQLIDKRDLAYENKDFSGVKDLDKQINASSRKITQYRRELSASERNVDKYAEKMGMIEEKAIQTSEAISRIEAEQERLKKTGSDTQDSEAMRKTKYEAQELTEKLVKLQQQKEAMEKAGTATINGKETKEYGDVLKKAAETEKELQEIVGKAQKDTKPLHIKEWEQMPTITHSIAEGFARVQYAGQMAGHAIAHPLEALNRLLPIGLSGLGQLAQKALDVAASFAKMAVSKVASALRGVASAAINAAAGFARMVGSSVVSFIRKIGETAKNAAVNLAQLVGRTFLSGLKKLGLYAANASRGILGLGNSARKSNKGLNASFKTILRYAFGVRSMFFLVKRLRSTITEALGNIARIDKPTNKALSSMTTALNQVKNSLGSAFQPIVTAVAPYVTQLLNLLSSAITKIAEFFAVLTGQDYVIQATAVQEDYAKSLDKTKKSSKAATKEVKNQLAAFDHLNILSAPADNGSNSGSDTDVDPSKMFKKVSAASFITDFMRELKAAIEAGDFFGVGTIIAGKLNEAFAKIQSLIKWDTVGDVVTRYVDTVANIFNGLIDPDKGVDFNLIGTTVAEGANTVVNALNRLADDIHWGDIGLAIASGLNGMIERFNFKYAGSLLAKRVNIIADTLYNFFENFKWAQAAYEFVSGLNEWIGNIKWGYIGKTIASGMEGALEFIKTAVINFKWGATGVKFAVMLNNFFKNENLWKYAGMAIDGAIKGLADFGTKFLNAFNATQVAIDIKTALGKIKWREIAENVWETAKLAFRKAGTFLDVLFDDSIDYGKLNRSATDVNSAIYEKMLAKNGSNNESWAARLGRNISSALTSIFKNKTLFETVGTTFNQMLIDVLKFGQGFIDGFKADEAADAIKAALGEIKWQQIATEAWATIKKFFAKAGSFVDALFAEDVDYTRMQIDPAYAKKIADYNSKSLGGKMGQKLASAINAGIKALPTADIGDAIETALNGVIDFGTALVENFDAATFTDKVFEVLESVPWLKIAGRMVQLLIESLGQLDEVMHQAVYRLFGFTEDESIEAEIQRWASELWASGAYATYAEAEADAKKILGIVDDTAHEAIQISADGATEAASGSMSTFILETLARKGDAENAVKGTFDEIWNALDANGQGEIIALDYFNSFMGVARDSSGNYTPEFKAIIESMFGSVEAFEKSGVTAKEFLEGLVQGMWDSSGTTSINITRVVDWLFSDTDSKLILRAEGQGENYINALSTGAENGKEQAKKGLGAAVNYLLEYVENEELEQGSPSKRAMRSGKWYVEGFAKGAEEEKNDTQSRVSSVFGDIVDIGSHMYKIANTVNTGMIAVKNLFESNGADIESVVGEMWDNIAEKAKNKLQNIRTDAHKELKDVKTTFVQNFNSIKTSNNQGLTDIHSAVTRTMSQIISTVTGQTNNANMIVSNNFASIRNNIVSNLYNAMNQANGIRWSDVGMGIINGIQAGLNNGWRWLRDSVANLASALLTTAKNALGIHSPSRLFRDEVGRMVGLGMAEGIDDAEPFILGNIEGIGDAMADKMSAIANSVAFRTPAMALGNVMPYNISAIVSADSQSDALVGALTASNDDLSSVIMQVVNNATSAIVGAIQRYGAGNGGNTRNLTDTIIDDINRRAKAQGHSPIII